MDEVMVDRCPTGIVGFDTLCSGGFVRNSDNLIVGGPGTGKSTFMLQFLWNGAMKFNENGLYCSFEPDVIETLHDGMAHGWDFSKLNAEGRIQFMRFSPQTSVGDLKKEFTKIVSRGNIKRICFDPISVLALNLNEQGKVREAIFELSSLLKRLRVTVVSSDESLEGDGLTTTTHGELSKTDILRFLSDSVTFFSDTSVPEFGDRSVRIAKMRRTKHERKSTGMQITQKGIEIGNEQKPIATTQTAPQPTAQATQPAPQPTPATQPATTQHITITTTPAGTPQVTHNQQSVPQTSQSTDQQPTNTTINKQ